MILNRRQVLKRSLLSAGALVLEQALQATRTALLPGVQLPLLHSACRWCYADFPLEELCERGLDIGLHSIELLKPTEWKVARSYGLACAVGTADFISITAGFNDKSNHRNLQKQYRELLPLAAEDGIPNLICFSGNRNGLSDEKGLDNCARGLEPLLRQAEKLGVTLIMELLNSKVDHPDYMCDHTAWGVALVEKLGSPNFKLLYDIYHMQIMEGDLIRTIRDNADYIAHYHTGGVPGRHEINSQQEINYPAVVRAIIETGYTGYLGQEFIPTYEDKISALEESIWICSKDY
ncbi:MAG: hydroxypyruvate isomerase [Bacteroidetes bacterium]|nr:MAG: hydroxypyruvate isomerase [Bacteroidota bacterium]